MKKPSMLIYIILSILCCFSLCNNSNASSPNDDIRQLFEQIGGSVIFDFENGDLSGWQVESGNVNLTVSDQIKDFDTLKQTRFLTTGGKLNDIYKPKGTIKSSVFQLKEGWITFLVGGGTMFNKYKNYVALCLEDGNEVLKAECPGSDLLQRIEWDANQYVGKNVFLRIVDKTDRDKGYISFDDFRQINYQTVKSIKKQIEQKRQQNKTALLQDKALFAPGTPNIYSDQNLTAIDFPLGGIGSGCIHLDGKAKRPVWEIFNSSQIKVSKILFSRSEHLRPVTKPL
ncbi:MAG: hypothetical protein ACHQVK_02745 [Candidatus Paceibacterales bacterium]